MEIIDLGKTEYNQALKLQKEFFEKKLKNPQQEDIVLITEHYPVYTLGKTTKKEHLINIPSEIPVVEIERGGSVTFHGEGQIVVYPIISLTGERLSVKNFVWSLEEVMIQTLKEFDIEAYRQEKLRGVFTPKGKIGFIGVKISRFISYHGFSLNINVDKTFFDKIIPCGITDIPVCNMADFIPEIDIEQVKPVLKEKIKMILGEK
ncbi:lipoyl(octanoyl) transferase LipB [Persephonella sp. KM09-Lau-8]|uniref:lipoyl(octanoyl) transferase LipB n=1 Tax=Persephonella sp. KM09-Lau-8 TaxID=1158345 RepID=UPI000496CBFB|nr:lipoyl(octanoyl) transferase LipB [Persephonella sp. KM09-Lau-8]